MLAVATAGLALFASGCEDNPADDGGPVCEHVDADGLVIEDGGLPIAAQWEGVVTGEIDAETGHLGNPLIVTFLSADSTRISVATECTDHSLVIEVADPLIAAVEQPTGERWTLRVRGLSEGTTTLRIRLWHGDHADFTSQPIPVHVIAGEEQEAAGLVLRSGSADLANVWMDQVTGEVEVPIDALSELIEVTFLDPDSVEFQPPSPEHELGFTIADSSIAGFRAEGVWSFRLEPKTEGETTLSLIILHEGHVDYTSPPIPVHVHAEVEAAALIVRQNGSEIATWNFDPVMGPNLSTGEIIVGPLATLSNLAASFLDPDGGEFIPEDPDMVLGVEIADPGVATVALVPGERWQFTVTGVTLGSTTAVFSIQHESHSDFTSGPIRILVSDVAPGVGTSFILRKNGIPTVIVVDGAVVPSCGTTIANPGQFETAAGDTTELYSFRLLAPDCTASQISATRYSLAFEFADSAIARVVNHPEHWNETTVFHLEGVAAGQTALTVRLLDQGQVSMTSPPIPVVITAGRGLSRPVRPGEFFGLRR
jgi:hypothetical protein